jgi:hypothetical protein
MRTENWPRPTLGLVTGGKDESGNASEIYGPLKAGLTTTLRTNREVALLELLRYLEKRVEILEYRYSEVCAILENDIIPRAERLLSTIEKDTTD